MAFKWANKEEEAKKELSKKDAKKAAKEAKKAEKEAAKLAKKAKKAPVAEEPKKAAEESKTVEKKTAKTSASAAKAPAKKTTAAAKPAAKSTATAAPKTAAKSAPKASDKAKSTTAAKSTKPAVKATVKKAPAKKTNDDIPVIPTARPFFMPTEEEIRVAFDEAIAQADAQIAKNGNKAVGKYEFSLEVDGFHFYLIANNGQILFDSPSFANLINALNGIQTFKKTVLEGDFKVKVDKYGRYRFILARKYYSENYTSKEQCQKCVDSVKNFANNAKIIFYTPDKQELAAFEKAKDAKRRPDDIDWKAVAAAEAKAPKMGKFEICEEKGGDWCFYLLANNGQILYASRYFASEAACRKGVESFKRAAYVGNFFVDRDKFGNYRYVLKNIGSAPAFIGESYDNRPQCEKIIDSVKKFIVSASIELDK